MTEKWCFRALFCQISSDEDLKFDTEIKGSSIRKTLEQFGLTTLSLRRNRTENKTAKQDRDQNKVNE